MALRRFARQEFMVQAVRRTAEGIEIDVLLTRRDLVEITGTALQTVSRTLSERAAIDLIAGRRQKVVILAPQRPRDDRRGPVGH